MSQRIDSRDSLGFFGLCGFFKPYDPQQTKHMWDRFAPGEIALAPDFELALAPVFMEYRPSQLPVVLP